MIINSKTYQITYLPYNFWIVSKYIIYFFIYYYQSGAEISSHIISAMAFEQAKIFFHTTPAVT